MKANEILSILKDAPEIYKSILITGPWGIGKTYYVEKYAKDNESDTIYISFFGKENSEQVKSEIGFQLMPKDARVISRLYKSFSDYSGNVNLLGSSIKIPTLYKNDITIYKKRYSKKKKLTIVFDDLERKSEKYSIVDLFGLLDEVLKLDDISIVILANEEKVNDEEKVKLNEFKEKVVERTYYISEYSTDALSNIIQSNIGEPFWNNYNEEIENFVKEFFKEQKISNLRTVISATKFLNEILSIIDTDDFDKIKFSEILGVCYSVVIENIEEIHLHTGEKDNSNDGFDFLKEINKDIVQRICHHYLKGSFYKTTIQHQFVKPINDIFNDVKKTENIEIINELLKAKRDKQEKHNFYKSRDQLLKQINDFNENYVAKKGDIDFLTWLYNLDIQYVWIEILEYNHYKEKDIEKRIKDYLSNYLNLNTNLYNSRIDDFGGSYQSVFVKKLIGEINKRIDIIYYEKIFDDILISFSENSYNKIEYIDVIINFMKNINLQKLAGKNPETNEANIEKSVYTKLKNNNWIFPIPADEIDEIQWAWCRKVWQLLSVCDIKQIKKFIRLINKDILERDGVFNNRISQLQQNYTILGVDLKKKD